MKINTLLIICLILACPRISPAQVGVNVCPPLVDMQVLPGASQTGTIQVQNPGGDVVVTAKVLNCLTDIDGVTNLEGDDTSFVALRPCASWVKINPEEFGLLPNGFQMVRYTVYVPPNARGGYRLALVFQTKPKKVIGSGTAISVRLMTFVNINVVGTGAKKGEVNRIELLNQGDKNIIRITFKNMGNTMLYPTGILEIKNMYDSAVSKLTINSEKKSVMPGQERRYKVNVDSLNSGQYLMTATMDYGGPELTATEVEVNIKPALAPPPITSPPDKPRSAAAPKASPKQVKAWYKEASRFYFDAQYDKALVLWQKIVQADPGNASARKNLEKTKSKLAAMKKAGRG